MHELDSSFDGQREDLLAAWRQLSATDSMPPGPDSLEHAYIYPQLDEELERHAGLAASWSLPEQPPLQAPLTNNLIADTYMSAAWGVSDSPSMLMGSPDQCSQQHLPFSDSARAWQSSHFPESPEQLPQYRTWPPMLEDAAEYASHPFSLSAHQDLLPCGLGFASLEPLSHTGSSEAVPVLPESSLGLQLDLEAGVSEQSLGQPSEEDLYAMMASFQDNCSQLPAEDSDRSADLAAMSPIGSQMQRVEQQDAASPHDMYHNSVQSQGTADATSQQGMSGVANHPIAASEAEFQSKQSPAMFMDCLEPDEAARMPLTENMLRSERLATCSDDEEFAVLDFGGPSEGSSECSFGAERTATCQDHVYSAPR